MTRVAPDVASPIATADVKSGVGTLEVERRVLEILQGLVGELRGVAHPDGVALDASLDRDLGLGSLERVELLLRLEHAFGVALPDTVIRTVIRKAGHLTVERFDPSQSVADADRLVEALRGGTPLLMFPEGTFLSSPRLLPLKFSVR